MICSGSELNAEKFVSDKHLHAKSPAAVSVLYCLQLRFAFMLHLYPNAVKQN